MFYWNMESISGILQNYTDEEITWKLMSTKALMSVIFMTKNLHQSTNGQKMKHSILQDFLILFFVFVMLEFGTFVIFWRAWNSPFHLCQHEQFYARCSKSWSSYHVIFIKIMFSMANLSCRFKFDIPNFMFAIQLISTQ